MAMEMTTPPFNWKTKEAELRNLKKNVAETLLSLAGNIEPVVNLVVQFYWPDLRTKYIHVDLSMMLSDNCKSLQDVDNVLSALNILTKYAVNLLSPIQLRPSGWNVIDFLNPIYHEKVHPIKGTLFILCKLGYTESRPEAQAFPLSTEPLRHSVAEITVELMACKMELQYYIQKVHKYPNIIEKYLSCLTFIKSPGSIANTIKPYLDMPSNGLPKTDLNTEATELKLGSSKDVDSKIDYPDNIPLMVLDQVVSTAPNEVIMPADVLGTDRCDICGIGMALLTCSLCDDKNLCKDCDDRWHQHPKRRTHKRTFCKSRASNVPESGKNGFPVENQNHDQKLHVGGGGHLAISPATFANSTTGSTNRGIASGGETTLIKGPVFMPSQSKPSVVQPVTNVSQNSRNTLPQGPSKLLGGKNSVVVDDIEAILSQAKHPPAFYVPPVPSLLMQNGEIGSGLDIRQAPQAVSRHLDNSGYSKTLDLPRRDNFLERSASASGNLANSSRETNGTLTQSTYYWNCEYCTFTNTYLTDKKNRICSMCMKTNNDLKIFEKKEADQNQTPVIVRPSHLAHSASAVEPSRHDQSSHSGQSQINKKDFKSKFVDIQDEMYREKKEAQERFKREEIQRQKQSQTFMAQASHYPDVVQTLPAGGASASVSVLSSANRITPQNQNITEFSQPENHKLNEAAAANSASSNQKHYRSKFVDTADEIYLEKKAAQEEFKKRTTNQGSSVSRPFDQVEFARFQGEGGFGEQLPLPNRISNERQPVLKQSGISTWTQGVLGDEASHFNMMSKIEQLEQEKTAQEMYNNGMMVVRLLKHAEMGDIIDAELDFILSKCGTMDPSSYYKDKWLDLVDKVLKKLQDNSVISKDNRPRDLVRLSLAESKGDLEKAVQLFNTKWLERVNVIIADCGMENSEDNQQKVNGALDSFNGNVEAAKRTIVNKKFLERIWNTGVDLTTTNLQLPLNDDIYQRSSKHLNIDLEKRLTDETKPRERRIRMILAETDLPGWQRAENVLAILEEPDRVSSSITLLDVVDAVKNRGSVDESRQFLQQQCEICYDVYPSRLIKSMGCCQCKICCECTKSYFEVVIRERFVRNLVCPVCSLPEIDTSEQTETHFQFLLLMLRRLISNEVYELFQMKLRDWNLMMDPSFRWCASNACKSGFLIDLEQHQYKIACPHCNSYMCQKCKKMWEDQHENLSCEEFQSWKENNDPEVQALGLARHLEENGIECPRCKCRYSLAKGGCMHFTCIQCRHEFCSGCLQPFRRGKNCTMLKSCAKAGLHCHHPRDCLFYLRDRDTTELQKLLLDNRITYDTEPSQTRLLAVPDGQRCSVMEQKQTQNGFKDETCGKEVPPNYAGLCEIHYKEYLVGLINKNNIDPATIMKQQELKNLLERVEKKVPKQKKGESSKQYEEELRKIVQSQIPLPQRKILTLRRPTRGADQTDGFPKDAINIYLIDSDPGYGGEELIGRGHQMIPELQEHHMLTPSHKPINRVIHMKRDSGYSSLVI